MRLPDRYCGRCRTAHSGRCPRLTERMDGARARGYSKRWDRLSLLVRSREPLCRRCRAGGRIVTAECVDHIVPVRIAPERIYDLANLQPLCARCNAIKAVEDAGRYGIEISKSKEGGRVTPIPTTT